MKVVIARSLIHPKSGFMDQPQMPPLAIYSLGSLLKEKGFDVRIIDPFYYGYNLTNPQLLEDLLKDADVFCLSTTTFQWNVSIEIFQALRKVRPTIPVIVGGVHISYFAEQVMQGYPVDFAVSGEGEEVLPDLLTTLSSGRNPQDVDGIWFKDGGNQIFSTGKRPLVTVENLEKAPIPDFFQLPDGLYHVLPFETSRGCMNNCAFCSIAHRGHWRGLSSDSVLDKLADTLSQFQNKFLTPVVYFVDDCFTVNELRATRILSGIRDRGIKCSLMLEARIDQLVQGDLIACLGDSEISMIQIGVECGYNEGLEKVGKGTNVDEIMKCCEMLKKHKLNHKAVLSFIIGLPWEDSSMIFKTVHFAAELLRKHGVQTNTSWWVPMPSRLWYSRAKYGINLENDIFSDPLWFASPKYFPELRPLVSKHEQDIVSEAMQVYWDIGSPLVASKMET